MRSDGTGNPKVSLNVPVTEDDLQPGIQSLDMGVINVLGCSWGEGTVPATSVSHCRE